MPRFARGGCVAAGQALFLDPAGTLYARPEARLPRGALGAHGAVVWLLLLVVNPGWSRPRTACRLRLWSVLVSESV
jgi:hypothetical protein